jgi:hypothetical protein
MVPLHVCLLLALCLASNVYSEPRKEPVRPGVGRVEHIKSIACEDKTTGIEFSPLGICFDLMDDLYVVDSDHSRIYTADAALEDLAVFSECPSEYRDCEFVDLAGTGAGGVYVSERSSGSVLALDRWGELGAGMEIGDGVAGITSGKAGKVLAAMGIQGSVRMLDFDTLAEGLESRISHDDSDAYPVDCRILANGTVVVTDAFSAQVFFLSPLGELRGTATGFEFESPFGVSSFEEELIMVSDSDRGLVAVFDRGGGFLFAFGEGILAMPTFLDCRADGLICVSDAGKMTIEVFRIGASSEE